MVSAKIKKKEKEYYKAKSIYYEADAAYQEACERASCYNCEIDKVAASLPFEKRYSRCKKEKSCSNVVKKHVEFVKAMSEYDETRMEYAQVILEEFGKVKPILYNRITKKDAKWDECFPSSFSEVIKKDLVNSLIALIELDGGRYRLK